MIGHAASEPAVEAVLVRIAGRVQGVGFRRWVECAAVERGLFGSVRNTTDGLVEAIFAGPPERVRDMVAACHDGPSLARVDQVRLAPAEVPRRPGFHILR